MSIDWRRYDHGDTGRETLFDLILALSEAMDLVNPLVVDHHKRTAWFAVHLAEEMGFAEDYIRKVLFASLLHDIGAFSLRERLDTLQFEFENPHHHACLGYKLLHDFGPLEEEARIILAHHAWWKPRGEGEVGGELTPVAAHIIHLANRIAILLEEDADVIDRAGNIIDQVFLHYGTMFMPEAVEAFMELAAREDLWFGAFMPDLVDDLRLKIDPRSFELTGRDLERLARVFARIIDYRSHFTATHSAGVAAVAEALARILGFSEENCLTVRVAGYLHDLGKLAIPTELLEKTGYLDGREYLHVQDHALHTRRLLEGIPELGYAIEWAAQHHERLNGRGYPAHSSGDEIAFGSRVVAVADILTAVTEERPYRVGMSNDKAISLLAHLTGDGYLDAEVYQAVEDNFEALNSIRLDAQAESGEDYQCRIEEALV